MSQAAHFKLPEHLAARESARRRESAVQSVAAVIMLLSFVGAGMLIGPVNQIRKERQLVIDPNSIAGLPPDIALLGKLGTFRALAIDWAAIRADRLQEEGKTYEAAQLHDTICKLAPRFPQVWDNAAWNMAYNISVEQFSPEARWTWVRNGIEILRDRGIEFNPNSPTLYKSLSWIYWHKIGDFLDDEHLNYKRALATEMESILGAPPVTLTDKEYFEWFKKIVDAPRNLKLMIGKDAEVARLASALRKVKLVPNRHLLEFVARNIRPELQARELLAEAPDEDVIEAGRLELLTSPKMQEPLDRLLAAVRSKVLREEYRFDLDLMFELMVDHYGPLDWRNAFSHSLYWSTLGDRKSQGHENINESDQINNARFILYGLQKLVTKGRMTLWPDFDDPFSSYIEFTSDTRYIPYLYDAYMEKGKEYFADDPRFREGTPGPVFLTGFISNMHNWIQFLYLEGGEENIKRAENFYAWLREYNREPDGSIQKRYEATLDEFVMTDLYNQLQTFKSATAIVRGFVRRALKQFSLGLNREGIVSLERAQKAHDIWQIATKTDPNARRKLSPLRDMVRDDIEAYILHPRVAPLYKARLWKNLPLPQRQAAYDRLRVYFEKLCAAQDPVWSVDLAFGEPPGMEDFRKKEKKLFVPARREDIELGKSKKR